MKGRYGVSMNVKPIKSSRRRKIEKIQEAKWAAKSGPVTVTYKVPKP